MISECDGNLHSIKSLVCPIYERSVSRPMDDKAKDDVFYVCSLIEYIGRVYQQLILSVFGLEHAAQGIREVFSSFISDAISDFETSVYCSNPDYLRYSYEDGYLLD